MYIDNINSEYITPITKNGFIEGNELYFKRDDLIPYSFGGNKARKAFLFFKEIIQGNYDCIVTYGSSHSNHCRVISNMAAEQKIPCCLISPSEVSDETYNSKFMKLFGADIITVPVEKVHETIDKVIIDLKKKGKNPYFIPGGGHGNIGTKAYVECYQEIKAFEEEKNIYFDYIFFASGTGTTHAGLVCGQILNNDNRKIIGISIARKNPRGRDIVIECIKGFLLDVEEEMIQSNTIFLDDYTGDGYGRENEEIIETIKYSMINYGIPLDSTYTGKAFFGMRDYLKKNNLEGNKVLFIHTGGTPLFFDDFGRF